MIGLFKLWREWKKSKPRKKGKFSKFWVTFIILLNIAFTVAVLITFNRTGAEPAALVASWFAFTTGELWLLADIKKKKIKAKTESEDNI